MRELTDAEALELATLHGDMEGIALRIEDLCREIIRLEKRLSTKQARVARLVGGRQA
jgi:hypothetical protein